MSEDNKRLIDIQNIMEMIPHRYPVLLIDRIIEIDRGKHATSVKNVTMNEPQFMGHFPGYPVMPGVLIIESMAQTAALVVVDFLGEKAKGKVVYFMTIDNARFRRPVTPGDTMHIHVEKIQSRGPVWKFKGTATVDGKVCAEATYSAMITETDSNAA
ncbi:MAG: 3-hydroxyacyl-ACP dehydratase FabZ [Alphaproteobacteria bacterium]|nr:3-hydroxyacyl-ACP dehydratase FabZ [Alphaproteobacteria bacterium]